MIHFDLQKDINLSDKLKAGNIVYLSGTIFTARDCAHKRIYEDIINKGKPPFDLKNKTVYYAGPCPKKENVVIGSIGPTTATRVDVYTPTLLDCGLKFMIGKGERNQNVVDSVIKNKAVYFAGIGGAGALYASKITKAELFMYPDLLSEAVYNLTIKDFPVVVAIDQRGDSIY